MPATDPIYITFNDRAGGRVTTQISFPSSVPLSVRESIQVDLHNFAGDRNALQKERDALSRQNPKTLMAPSKNHNAVISTEDRLAIVKKEFENTALTEENARWKWRAESAERELVALRQQHSALQRQFTSGSASFSPQQPISWMTWNSLQPNVVAGAYPGAGYMFQSPRS